jgi:ferritin-like metal-binding protein YciE
VVAIRSTRTPNPIAWRYAVMAAISTMQDLFEHGLRDIYHAEKQIVSALPKMAKAASDDRLRQALEMHLDQTKGQVQRLEQVFASLNTPARAEKCEALEGLVKEAEKDMSEVKDPQVRDAAIIVSAQKVEHYEIASYGSLCTIAEMLGHEEAAELLEETLDEEKETDQKLTELAMSSINEEALQQS